jgi:hypothetical protein
MTRRSILDYIGIISAYRRYGVGYGNGLFSGPTTLEEAAGVAVVNKYTNLLCNNAGRNCNFDNDCCSKNCKRHNIEGTGRSIKACA